MIDRRNQRWFWLQLTIGAVRLHPQTDPGGTGTSTGLSVWLYLGMSSRKISEVIRGNQRHSEAILGNERQSEAIRGNQSVPRRELEAVCVHGRPAVVDAGEKAETHPRDEQPKGDDEERRHQRNDEETTLHARM